VNAIAPGDVETEGTHNAGITGSDFEKTMITRRALVASDSPTTSPALLSSWPPTTRDGSGERLEASGGYR